MTGARQLHIAEPPAQYVSRPALVVDCSVVSSALFKEASQAAAEGQMHGRALAAPYLLPLEFASVALKKREAGVARLADDGLAEYATLNIDLYPVDAQDAFAVALQHGLSAYDASYLWLAAHLKAPLATFDQKLAAAARTHLANLE